MMIFLNGNDFKYETEKLCRIFLPYERFDFTEILAEADIVTSQISLADGIQYSASVVLFGQKAEYFKISEMQTPKESERILAVLLYRCFERLTGYSSSWGILTGVRPAKLFSHMAKDIGIAETEKYFKEKLLVSPDKIELCRMAIKGEDAITSLSKKESFSLYIGIPFCPSRCSYCSFVSHSVEHAKKLIPQYVQLLCREIEITAKIAEDCHLKPETVYIGGGTPTTLSSEQLSILMDTVRDNFNLNEIREYTVEAGRPDTITPDKLEAIKHGGATRISINPQTMNNLVLEIIGRHHTAEQTVEAFRLARSLGFNNINMDLIAGLTGDTFESFKDTVAKIIALDPESVTIHTLCLKRSSRLNQSGDFPELEAGKVASQMVDYGKKELIKAGIHPYYMYRQSKMVGNLENVGYAKPGYEGLYNVYIMDETHTILACGASAVTKLRRYGENVIERIYNFKYPYEYISRFLEQMDRKKKVYKFYDTKHQQN